MALIEFQLTAAAAANVPFAPPTSASLKRIVAVKSVVYTPATSGADSDQIQEFGVASGSGGSTGAGTTGNLTGGQASFSPASQEFSVGDDMAVSGVFAADVLLDRELPLPIGTLS